MIEKWSRRSSTRLALLLLGVPALAFWLLELSQLNEFFTTGRCPALAPDIPSTPCTLREFLTRGRGAFELAGAAIILLMWFAACAPAVLAWAAARELWAWHRSGHADGIPLGSTVFLFTGAVATCAVLWGASVVYW